MSMRPFAPAWGNSQQVANAATATASITLPEDCQQVALYNTSATATTTVYIAATATAPTTSTGFPIPPGQMIRLTVGPGTKYICTIADSADGYIWIIPGNGD